MLSYKRALTGVKRLSPYCRDSLSAVGFICNFSFRLFLALSGLRWFDLSSSCHVDPDLLDHPVPSLSSPRKLSSFSLTLALSSQDPPSLAIRSHPFPSILLFPCPRSGACGEPIVLSFPLNPLPTFFISRVMLPENFKGKASSFHNYHLAWQRGMQCPKIYRKPTHLTIPQRAQRGKV